MLNLRTFCTLSAALLMSIIFVAGCGGETDKGPKRYQISGTVTFEGKPVPYGTISFMPDSEKGNQGPQGIAEIVDGKFNTATKGKGIVGGPHQITITGASEKADPNAPEDLDTPARDVSLFKPFETEFDFPKEDTTKNFDVK